ncbi:MAG: amidohydrolase [Desulfosarcinaceae bacterium]
MYDTLIHNGLVVTLDDNFTCLSGGAVAVREGAIEQVWTPDTASPLPKARELVDAGGGMVLPGLVNAHTHLPMSLFRGLADDLPLQQWLHEHIFPAEAEHLSEESVDLGTRISCAEMLLNGITTCCDGYFLADRIAQTVAACGMRAILGQGVIDFPAPGVPDPAGNVDHALAYVRDWKAGSPLVHPSIFCHSPYTCSPRTLQAAKAAARDEGVLFQIHVAETRDEVEQCRARHGCSPVKFLQQLDLLDAATLLVHAVWLDRDDVDAIAGSGAGVVHCPESNMKLASGIAPLPQLLAAGVPVALGTDGCASNNDLDLFGEMDSAAKLHKVRHMDPEIVDAVCVVRMATSQGARTLGLARQIGSLAPGKRADLVVMDGRQPHLTPLYHPASHLVYAARGGDVRHVMVDGRWLVRDRNLLTLHREALVHQARVMAGRIGPRMMDAAP